MGHKSGTEMLVKTQMTADVALSQNIASHLCKNEENHAIDIIC